MRQNTSSRFIGTKRASEILGISIQAINDMIHAGKFPGAFKVGVRFWAIPRVEVMAVKKQRENEDE